jgi:hypothetical protein
MGAEIALSAQLLCYDLCLRGIGVQFHIRTIDAVQPNCAKGTVGSYPWIEVAEAYNCPIVNLGMFRAVTSLPHASICKVKLCFSHR